MATEKGKKEKLTRCFTVLALECNALVEQLHRKCALALSLCVAHTVHCSESVRDADSNSGSPVFVFEHRVEVVRVLLLCRQQRTVELVHAAHMTTAHAYSQGEWNGARVTARLTTRCESSSPARRTRIVVSER